ncbi:MAG: hypothetical protein JWO39_1345 [Gemmatimonadetes bacterium]|nr:hypothetical protein [Gemmatimonadota bacterium]
MTAEREQQASSKFLIKQHPCVWRSVPIVFFPAVDIEASLRLPIYGRPQSASRRSTDGGDRACLRDL